MANECFESVWDALADSPEEAENLKARAQLMMQITEQIKSRGWDLDEAAKRFNAPQHEIQSLLDGHLAKFNLSALEAIAVALVAE